MCLYFSVHMDIIEIREMMDFVFVRVKLTSTTSHLLHVLAHCLSVGLFRDDVCKSLTRVSR